ncbi:MAG: ribose-phosphate diphosphokinase [archaeon]
MAQYKGSIIADPKGNSWELACKIYKYLIEKSEDFELNELSVKRFRDGEIKPKIMANVRGKNCFFIHDSSLLASEWHLQLCLVNNALRNSSAHEIIDVVPYLRFSRQDRKEESRVPISAQVIADNIGSYDHTRILTIEVHNLSVQGFYRVPFDSLYTFPIVISYIKNFYPEILEDIVIMSPDAGGAKRAESFAKRLGKNDVAFGYKSRPTEGEVDKLKILGDVKDKNVLIIDDIVDSGNTLINAAKSLREQGAKNIYAYCTHGLFTEGVEKVTSNFNKFFIGDTIKQEPNNNLEIISFASLLAEAILRISNGHSLSALFE